MYSTRSLPEAISHRGLRHSAPENTRAAFNAAIDAGAEGIELDVHATADGTVVVHHDPEITSLDGATVTIASAYAGVIESLLLPDGERVATLDEVLEVVGTRARVYIEIKARQIENDVARCLKRHAQRADNHAVHAFDHRIVKRLLEIMPSIRTGILQVAYPVDSRHALRSAGATDLWQQADSVDATLVADVHSAGGRIIAWTANTEQQWTSLASLGVDGICTDRVDAYVAWRDTVHPT